MLLAIFNFQLYFLILVWMVLHPGQGYTYNCDPQAECGCSENPVTMNKIVGGEAAGVNTWGWAVFLYIDSTYLCGGSLISDRWIITAAHCVDLLTATRIIAYVGSNVPFQGENRTGSTLIVHPDYDPVSLENDIALLRVNPPFNMSVSTVKLLCLANVDVKILATEEWPPVRTTVAAIGWGTLSFGGLLPETLQQVTLRTFSSNDSFCKLVINNSTVQMCAGVEGGGKDTCQGDSGGPLMMFTTSKQWVLVGLTSYGSGCASPKYAGIYTRTAYYHNWIGCIIGKSYHTAFSSFPENIDSLTTTLSSSSEPITISDSHHLCPCGFTSLLLALQIIFFTCLVD